MERFRELLQEGSIASRVHGGRISDSSTTPIHAPSSGHFSVSSASSSYKAKGSADRDGTTSLRDDHTPLTLTRSDINAKDTRGLTLLHHAASSVATTQQQFALALIGHPYIDLYAQDYENGWTALHRALYFGNITVARAILERDVRGAANSTGLTSQFSSLVRVKDREGHGPYDILTATIADRSRHPRDSSPESDDSSSSTSGNDSLYGENCHGDESSYPKSSIRPSINVQADELFVFGSNRNFSLGLSDHDDRQYPERTTLKRPKRLFQRFHREYVMRQADQYSSLNPAYAEKLRTRIQIPKDVSDLPNVVRSKQLFIQDVQMSRFHTAILTTDAIANLYVCGHGVGGRLGTGNEKTLFNFTCLDEFWNGHINSIALGQDHTLAVTNQGELYSWGSNVYGQLGCGLPKENTKPEEAVQLSPKQLFGSLKKETVLGVAASRIHSVAHTGSAIFTFGKNEGQLGLVDSQAGTLKMQSTPRQVHASRLSSTISAVSAIERATVILLENREVHVFANYGAVKLQFPLEGFSNYYLKDSSSAAKYDSTSNKICKITSGGETICALSTYGQVFTVTVNQRLDPSSSGNVSTTNPNKIKAALSSPHRAWNLKNDLMAARDVAVDADGSIILATRAGGVFRRVRRPKFTNSAVRANADQKANEFKFMRVPNLTRAVAVRASAFGAYCAMREDCNVTRTELETPSKTIWHDVFSLLPFNALANEASMPRFWQRADNVRHLIEQVSRSNDVETDVAYVLRKSRPHIESCDIELCTSSSEYSIPAHQVILGGRSNVLRHALAAYRNNGQYSSEIFSITRSEHAQVILTFRGFDFLTLFEMVLYLYADALVGFWRLRHQSPDMAFRYKQVRAELMKIGARLELKPLEAAARKVTTRPDPSLAADFEMALLDPSFYANCDARVQLADGELLVHSILMAKRCPFFDGLFQGHAGGRWLSERRAAIGPTIDLVEVDLCHIELRVFKLALRYIYADAGQELFDDVVTTDLDDFLDLVMDVLSIANELMLDNLSRTCQAVLGQHVTTRNACQLLNAVAPSSIQDFKNVTLEYLCLSLESVLANHWLDDLDEDLLHELDQVVQDNQCAAMPLVRSGRIETLLHQRHPQLAEVITRARQAKLDALELKAKFPTVSNSPSILMNKIRLSPAMYAKTPTSQTPLTPPAKSSVRIEESLQTLEPLPSPANLDQTSSLTKDGEETASATTAPRNRGPKPWGPAPLQGTKLGLKDIMAQASSSQASNLSLGLQSQATQERSVSSSTSTKISQKERKRQQQQRMKSDQTIAPSTPVATSSATSNSPWKQITPPRKATSSYAEHNLTASPSDRVSSSPRQSTTPQLTMRQTIANAPPSNAPEPIKSALQTSPPMQRSVSTPHPSEHSGPSNFMSPPRDAPALKIQSIRHQPRPESSPNTYMDRSLADIMSLEQAEKTTLKDSVAKRSLQEIQEEQAFQVSQHPTKISMCQ